MSNNTALPAHIRQLVDKKNYVIAIKTHAQEQGISMEEAKNQIDAYEAQAVAQQPVNTTPHTPRHASAGLNQLQQSLDSHLQQQHINLPLIPRWVWRVSVIILVVIILGVLLYGLFGF